MVCSKCGKAVPDGAAKCACGGAPKQGEFSYDLLPEEEKKEEKKEEAPAFMLPPGVSAPPGSPPAAKEGKPARQRSDRHHATLNSGIPLKKIGLIGAVLVIVVLLGMRMCGGGPSVTLTMMNNKSNGTANVSNNIHKIIPFQLVGETTYRFKVEALDDEVRIGMPERASRDKVTPEIVKGWSLTPVKKGESQTLEGKVTTGSYSFVIVTDSKKGVRAKFEYEVKK